MTRPIRLRVLAALLPLACACSTSSSARRSPHDVTLRFDWPQRFAARVFYTYEMHNSVGDMEVHRQFWLTVEPGDKEGQHRLVPRDMKVFPAEYAAIVDPEPTVLFDDAGEFQGIELTDEGPGLGLLEALPLEPEKKAEVRGTILSRQEEDARGKWRRMVTHWNGITLTPGEERVRRDGTMVVARRMREHEEVPAEQRVFFEAGVPCSAGAPERRCVRVSVVTQPLGQSQEQAGPMASWKFELVTDPDTLVPYSTRMVRKDRVDWGADGEVRLQESEQVEEYVFTYGAEPVPAGSRSL